MYLRDLLRARPAGEGEISAICVRGHKQALDRSNVKREFWEVVTRACDRG